MQFYADIGNRDAHNGREFVYDTFLGDDWVMPLPAAEARPFAFAEHAKKSVAPAFPAGAALAVAPVKAKNRGSKAVKANAKSIPAEAKDCLKITFPPANAAPGARAHEYEIAIEKRDGSRDVRYVLPPGFNMRADDKRALGEVSCTLALDQLPKEEFRFVVTPVSSLEKKGSPIASDWRKI